MTKTTVQAPHLDAPQPVPASPVVLAEDGDRLVKLEGEHLRAAAVVADGGSPGGHGN